MIGRITNQMMSQSAGRNLQTSMAALAKLQNQASSQKAISRPSDDPAATAASLQIRSQQAANTQYARNIDDGMGWLTMVDSSLKQTTTVMNRVRDLTVQGANQGTLSSTARDAIVTELQSLKGELLDQANTQYQGRSIYAGTSDAPSTFTTQAGPPVTYSYAGATGATVERRISAAVTVRVDVDGSAVFGTDGPSGNDSVFSLIDSIVGDLNSGVNVAPRLDQLDVRMNAILGQRAAAGTRQAQLQRAQDTTMNQKVTLEGQRAGVEDIDLAQTILNLQTQQVSYQAALSVTAKVLQPTLMDFLK